MPSLGRGKNIISIRFPIVVAVCILRSSAFMLWVEWQMLMDRNSFLAGIGTGALMDDDRNKLATPLDGVTWRTRSKFFAFSFRVNWMLRCSFRHSPTRSATFSISVLLFREVFCHRVYDAIMFGFELEHVSLHLRMANDLCKWICKTIHRSAFHLAVTSMHCYREWCELYQMSIFFFIRIYGRRHCPRKISNALADGIVSVVRVRRHSNKHPKCSRRSRFACITWFYWKTKICKRSTALKVYSP